MKNLSPGLAAHYLQGTTTLSHGIRVVRTDGAEYSYTSAQRAARIGGVTYRASNLTLTDVVTSLDMSVGNMELAMYVSLNDPVFNQADVFGGLWKNATFEIFEYNRNAPEDGKNPIVSGVFGEVTIQVDHYRVELRDWVQFLQQPIGEVSSKNCRNRLGDARCKVDLAAFTVAGTLSSVTSLQVFRDSSRTEADDWFGDGILTFTSGDCVGYSQKVKAYAADGTFTLMLPMFSPVQVGDTYTVHAGCRKRHDRTRANPGGVSDCIDKFGNILNFRGEPHRPGVDQITSAPNPVV